MVQQKWKRARKSTPPTAMTIRNLVAKFERQDRLRMMYPIVKRPQSARKEASIASIKNTITEFPTTSQRRLSAENHIPKSTIQRILKKDLHLKPFIPALIHQLIEDNFDRRVQFCKEFIALNAEDPKFADKIWWTEELTFKLGSVVNRRLI